MSLVELAEKPFYLLGKSVTFGAKFSAGFGALMAQTFLRSLMPPYRIKDFINQLNFVAVESLPIILICGCSAAMVTIIESAFHMRILISNDSLVPGFAVLLILRELGTIITGLLLTSRVGAGMAAEVGTMKVTEQIDAYRMLGMEPIKYIVVPRFLAGAVGGLLLTLITNVVCVFCAMVVTQYKLGYSDAVFWMGVRNFVSPLDLILSGVKGLGCGAIIPLVACYSGFQCKPGAEGVGLATTNAVVMSTVCIIVWDFLLSYLFTFIY